jgi:cytochrome b561
MALRDTHAGFGFVTRALHWIMALVIAAMFALGYWMVGLDYYSPYYVSAPDLHRSVGIVLLVALLARWGWRLINTNPADDELSKFERVASKIVQRSFYPLLLAVTISGYLISTSEGRGIDVFGLFTVPAVILSKGTSDTAGYIHRILSYITIALAALHTAAALKHHFVDRSHILTRMWSGPPKS